MIQGLQLLQGRQGLQRGVHIHPVEENGVAATGASQAGLPTIGGLQNG